MKKREPIARSVPFFFIQRYNAIYASPVRPWNHRHVNCLALYLPDKSSTPSHTPRYWGIYTPQS